MAVDWESKVGAPNVAVFGEPATYQPAAPGAQPYAVVGVFDNQFRSTKPGTFDEPAPITDRLPVFGVNQSQFQAEPQQDDTIIFAADAPADHAGKTYIVKESRPDGHGMYHLAINEAA